MKHAFRGAMFGLLFLSTGLSIATAADSTDRAIASRLAEVKGVKLHYLTAGRGPTLILLHGYAETSLMWKPIIPLLAERFTVIAPDLPGIGDSGIPNQGAGYEERRHQHSRPCQVARRTECRGGRSQYRPHGRLCLRRAISTEVTKLVLMDAFLPGVPGWEPIYNNPGIWHFRFNGTTPEALVQGRENTYFDYFWNDFAFDKNHSVPEAARKAYVAAYSRPGRMHAGWEYFVSFPQAAKDFSQLSQTKLTMPVLTIGGVAEFFVILIAP